MNKRLITLGAVAGGVLGAALMASTAFAATTTFGGAMQNNGNIALVSNTTDATTTNDYSGISFSDANGMTFGSLTKLSATFNVTQGDCFGGSPRFSIGVDTNGDGVADGNVFVYFGPAPNFTNCGSGSQTTGNFIMSSSTGTFDFSQLGGPTEGTFAMAPANVATGTITGIDLVVDAGWGPSGTQMVKISKVNINGTVHSFTGLMAPMLTSPMNGATLTSSAFTSAMWSTVMSSSSPVIYQYESSMSSSTNADGSLMTPIFTSGWLTTNSISTTGTPPGTYYWNVRAMDADGNMSPWSSVGMYTISNSSTVASSSLMAPMLTSPMNGATITSSAFTGPTWSAVMSSSSPVTYTYEVSNSSSTNAMGGFVTPLFQQSGLTSPMISTPNTPEGTYYWHVQAMDAANNVSPWSTTGMFTINNSTTTGTTTNNGGGNNGGTSLSDLIMSLQNLLGQFPGYDSQIQNLINMLNATTTNNGGGNMGTTTPPTNNGPMPMIDQNGQSVRAGTSIDFVGRNFGHEENVTIMLNGSTVATVHADGGGNFSTGSMTVPSTPGTYTYTFTGMTSGMSTTAVITVTS